MNKDLLFIITVFILIILGVYFVFFNGGLSNNLAFVTLNAIKHETGISFSKIEEKAFTYKYESGEKMDIVGMGFSGLDISNDSADKIRESFAGNGFIIDFFETGSDLSGTSYYSKDKAVCIFKLLILINETGNPEATSKFNADISCGLLAQ
jgi:hypothetical protein